MTTPSINELAYQMKHVVNDCVAHGIQLTNLQNNIDVLNETLLIRRTYMKQLLIYRAEQKQTTQVNDYISLLCSVYKKYPEIPDMDNDNTPGWLIADAVISESNDKDRLAFTDIFIYVYGYNPQTYFSTT
jgi:hypothetical protein